MFKNYPIFTRMSIIFLDNIVIILSFFIAVFIRNASLPLLKAIPKILYTFGFDAVGLIATEIEWGQNLLILILIVIVWRAIMGYQEAYEGSIYIQRFGSLKTEIIKIFKTVVIGCVVILSIAFLVKSKVPRSLIVVFGAVNFTMFSAERAILYQVRKYLYKKGKVLKEVLVLGEGDIAEQFIHSAQTYPDWGIKIKGLVCKDAGNVGKTILGNKVIGHFGDLRTILHSHTIDELIIALPAKNLGEIENAVNICDEEGISVSIISPFFRTIALNAKSNLIHGLPIISFLPVERNELELAVKRVIDIMGSFIGLVILSPLFVIIAILIKLDSPGPVFYRWKILGLNKKPLTSYKFRTMLQNADEMREMLMEKNEMRGAAFKIKDDPRITRVGKWLRKYSLDELPQLWSVLKGDLSLVGPRPPLQIEIEQFEGWHRRKLSVKPGITCLWQISGRNEIRDFNEWMRLDLKYIDEWSLWLDIKILIKTIPAVLKGTGR
jgi:exopolysaccharide biosynthesis polyprenyl glycosylphosphotransferase